MKIIFFKVAILLIVSAGLYNCNQSEEGNVSGATESSYAVDVYVAGYYQNPDSPWNYVSGYWKNGVWNSLSGDRFTEGLYVDSSGVYVAGNGGGEAGYWKNGTWLALSGTSPYANDVLINDGDIYIPGTDTNGTQFPGYWKNGVWNSLSKLSATSYSHGARSVALIGSDVYVCGYSSTDASLKVAGYWKNGVWNALPVTEAKDSEAYDIAVSGSDVYIVGYQTDASNLRDPGYWKNGVWVSLPVIDDTKNLIEARAITVDGSDVYAAGKLIDSADNTIPVQWKNGVLQELPETDIAEYSYAGDIAVMNDTVYTVGTTWIAEGSAPAALWENGVANHFDIELMWASHTATGVALYDALVSSAEVTDSEMLAVDAGALVIGYSAGDSESSVISNLTLDLAGLNGSTISWSSDMAGVVATDGIVVQPEYGSNGADVTLTATLTNGSASQNVTFLVTVPEASQPSAGTVFNYSANGININMVFVPGKTTFTAWDDSTQVTIANHYKIAETEVTFELWNEVYNWATTDTGGGTRADGGPLYTFANPASQGGELVSGLCPGNAVGTNQHPAICMSWRDAMVWTNALTEYYNYQNDTNLDVVYTSDSSFTTPIRVSTNSTTVTWDAGSVYSGTEDEPFVNPDARGFRLPAQDEWELASRYVDDSNGDGDIMDAGEYYPGGYASGAAADTSDFAATSSVAWFGNSTTAGTGNTTTTQAVGTNTANALGLFDMSGNAREYCFDWYNLNAGTYRVVRGGDWLEAISNVRVGQYTSIEPYTPDIITGFRLARNP